MWDVGSLDQLKNAVSSYDRTTVEGLCEGLIEHINASDEPFSEKEAKQVLNLLRRKRFFAFMRKVGDALLQSGQTAGNVRRQYAQSLIECGEFIAAIGVLEKLIEECADAPAEVAEAQGLIGRALKQQYVNSGKKTAAQQKNLNRAVAVYYGVYLSKPTEYLWHGINAVALAKRAAADGVTLGTVFDADEVAREILTTINQRTPDHLYAWDFATAAEACLALGRTAEAIDWMRQYVAAEHSDAFEIASTLRQFREVWRRRDSGEDGDLVAVLETALLTREGGGVSLDAKGVKAALESAGSRRGVFEKVFGTEGPVKYQWYVEGAQRARAVGRVEDRFGRGIGTGFLVRASDFFAWGKPDEIVFLTNAHVLGRTESGALLPKDAVVRFEAFDPKRTWPVTALIWESPMSDLDATFVRLEGVPADVTPVPLASAAEPEFLEGIERRFYVIGHPKGEALAISLNDNMQVGWKRPLLHYRTPTEPGSSGSPVLDNGWNLVALHHAGGKQMPRLDGHAGFYEANEGIWIHEIVHRTREVAAPPPEAATTATPPVAAGVGATPAARRGVVISYSHKDKKFLAELQKFLDPFVGTDDLKKWDDMDIRPGANWLAEIRTAMDSCRIAILLVSQDYLTSKFVKAEEFPRIIEASITGGLTIFWIAVGPSTFDKTKLAFVQAANDPARPLNQIGKAEREKEWIKIMKNFEMVPK